MRPLGATQQSVLRALKEHGGWGPLCGWIWDTQGGTKRVLDSLVKRGLVVTSINDAGHAVYKPAD
jgi:DNA-binding MarR family transcriptional regulator